MPHLQIITVSTREGRVGPSITKWFAAQAATQTAFTTEVVDLADVKLPLFDEPTHPRLGQYVHDHTKRWSEIVSRGDAYVWVTPEYNFGSPPSLLNALTYLSREWKYKAAGFVSYGGVSAGLRGVQMSKQVMMTLDLVPVTEQVAIPFFPQHLDKATGIFNPPEAQAVAAQGMLNALARWTAALAPMRTA